MIHHRNHLSIMSATGLTETGGIYSYDFTTGSGQAYGGTSAQKELTTGIWGMIGGDGDRNGTIGTSDKSDCGRCRQETEGYLETDYNLDAESNNLDKDDIWEPNVGAGTQVPN